jgi:hypothetical protein
MKKFLLILTILIFTQLAGVAMENKIKFDNETYNLSVNTENGYNYYPKGENSDNWHSKITIKNQPEQTNPTEAVANFAYQIQSQYPSASVLVYPEAAIAGYLIPDKNFYEYNTIFFQEGKKGLDTFNYAKRFYIEENNGQENTRKSAIEFAEKYNKKYMELVSKEASKYKFE